MSRHQFKFLVILNQLLILLGVVVYEISDRSLPPELKSFLGTDESVLNTQIGSVTSLTDLPYWFGVVIIIAGLVASVGLCLEQRWGRWLFAATFVAAVLSTLLTDFYINTGWTAFVSYLAGTTEGMIIALMFFSSIKRMFEKSDDED